MTEVRFVSTAGSVARGARWLVALAAIIAACAHGRGGEGAPAGGDWTNYNGTSSGDRYSSLAQITASNVAQMKQVCAFDAPDEVSFQTGLVAVDGTLYFTAFGNTYAIDASTCRQKWKHAREEPPNFLLVNRGVAWSDGKVFRGTGDAHVLGLDASTGKLLWDVAIGDPKNGESVPMSPIARNGLVFVGNAGGDNFGVTGRIYALDASSGKTVWEFHTVPESGPARATWGKASPENPPTGAATWTTYALDEAKGILYVTTGNPAPDFMEELHPGKNLYAFSVLALEAKTGKLISYVQPIQGDYHDWDVSAGPALITTRSGKPLVVAAAKDGYVYGIDRGAVPDRAASEPDSGGLAVRYKALAATRENAEAPLTSTAMTRFCPGSQGGMEWNGPAYHRDLGMVYVNSIDWCTSVKLKSVDQMKGGPGQPWSGMDDPKMAFRTR